MECRTIQAFSGSPPFRCCFCLAKVRHFVALKCDILSLLTVAPSRGICQVFFWVGSLSEGYLACVPCVYGWVRCGGG